MSGIFLFGFLLGLQHALEADHLAAVATLATRGGSLRAAARNGIAWGCGHALTLLVVGGAALLMGTLVPAHLAAMLECAVGLMLVVLGADVLRRLRRGRVHVHVHSHDGTAHFHAHTHADPPAPLAVHRQQPHLHVHPQPLPLRALYVGTMHGMAGSAALVLLASQTVRSPAEGLLYIALFGLGSILGMGVLSTVVGLPLRWTARGMSGVFNGLQAGIGALTCALGLYVMYNSGVLAS